MGSCSGSALGASARSSSVQSAGCLVGSLGDGFSLDRDLDGPDGGLVGCDGFRLGFDGDVIGCDGFRDGFGGDFVGLGSGFVGFGGDRCGGGGSFGQLCVDGRLGRRNDVLGRGLVVFVLRFGQGVDLLGYQAPARRT